MMLTDMLPGFTDFEFTLLLMIFNINFKVNVENLYTLTSKTVVKYQQFYVLFM